LRYDVAKRLKEAFPHLNMVLNGGIKTLEEAKTHLNDFSGVMLGRAVYHSPYLLAHVDREIFGEEREIPSREEALDAYLCYARQRPQVPLSILGRPLIGLYQGLPGAKKWRVGLPNFLQNTLRFEV
jgi:tRNA-dihydrouridine synthase A